MIFSDLTNWWIKEMGQTSLPLILVQLPLLVLGTMRAQKWSIIRSDTVGSFITQLSSLYRKRSDRKRMDEKGG